MDGRGGRSRRDPGLRVEVELVGAKARGAQVSRSVGEAASAPTGGEWRLVGGRKTFVISGRHVLGRDAGCDFTLSHKAVSRRHARLELRDGRLTLTDLGSANGTFVNGKRVRESVLDVGDEVRFDVKPFRVQGPDDSGRTTTRPAAGAHATRVRSAVGAAGATPPAKPAGRLEVVGGMEAKSFGLTKAKCVIGRAAESDIELAADSVSSRHAQLERTGDGWRLTDLQSTNGTFVNDRRVDSAGLKPGDRVRFGNVEVRLVLDAPLQPPREGTMVIQAPPDTPLVRLVRRVPGWAYRVAALVVVAVLIGFVLSRVLSQFEVLSRFR